MVATNSAPLSPEAISISPRLVCTTAGPSTGFDSVTVKVTPPASSFTSLVDTDTVVVSMVSAICAVALAAEKSTASKLPPLTALTVAVIELGSI